MHLQGELTATSKRPAGRSYSAAGYELTRRFEGLRLTAYQDIGGVWTIGYGHTGPEVVGGMTITEAEAELLLGHDVARAAACVESEVAVALSQGQFDALVDFVFNLGCGALRGSTLLRRVNAGEFALAAAEFSRWVYAGGAVVPGLLTRRLGERELFEC